MESTSRLFSFPNLATTNYPPTHTHTQYPQPNKKERKKNLLSSRKKDTQAGTNKTSQNVTDKT
jgi:hypothetical protein